MTTFQRCTNKSMGDQPKQHQQQQQQRSEPVFGARDELGATDRQIRGAAMVGGIAGAFVAGPYGAVVMAAGAAYAAARRECEIGEAARTAGDTFANKTEFVLQNEAVNRTVQECSRRSTKMSESAMRTSQSITTRAGQMRDSMHEAKEHVSLRAGHVKESVKSRIRRRGLNSLDNDFNEAEFHDCLDDTEEHFEDARYDEEDEDDDGIIVVDGESQKP